MSAVSGSRPRSRLLIVDDECASASALGEILTASGYDVTALNSPLRALDLLRTQHFELVLTDLKMPEMDGIQFLQLAQQSDHNLAGIVMTAYASVDSAVDAMRAGALEYVLKPLKLSAIDPVIRRALEVRRMRIEIAQLQERVQEDIIKLEAANDELESFAYSVSHDLRAPLRAISGFSTLLTERHSAQMPVEAQEYLGKIIRSVDKMGELIEHLLRFSSLNKQPMLRQLVDMKALVCEAIDQLSKESSDRPVQVKIGELPETYGDAVLLRQVVLNLLSNAFKFTRRREQPEIEIGFSQKDGEQCYFVRDNGAGFDMLYVRNLFRVFHRLHHAKDFEGTGIGLSLTQRIIQRHNGRIWAEAIPDQGATFYFTLPSRC
jgi:two-component system, sensor histidine kinase and response regulator